jgi:hypothetical protein
VSGESKSNLRTLMILGGAVVPVMTCSVFTEVEKPADDITPADRIGGYS